MEADLVRRTGIPYASIPAAGVHGVGLRALPGNVWRLVRGFFASRRILQDFRPDVLFFTGGYVAVPMAAASRFTLRPGKRPRSLLYVPDIEPGLALKTLARFADQIAVTIESTRTMLPGSARVAVTGYPTRPDLQVWNRSTARQVMGLSDDLPVVLVVGGSSGARSINRAVFNVLPELLGDAQVVHISGKLDWSEVEKMQQRLADELPEVVWKRYHPFAYLHAEMGAALASADLAISRAGASCLGEFPFFGLPALLVPYPYAWRYQVVNARYLEQHGAAVVVSDEDLPAQLLPVLRRILSDSIALSKMREEMRALAQPQAAEKIAGLIRTLGASR
jgi:UDP-N-acetylglucosamine--N-acetylmuramyl-(pentapeptide) pyrophosphoryl-undecaprenol N-acetylglucosamine transferase